MVTANVSSASTSGPEGEKKSATMDRAQIPHVRLSSALCMLAALMHFPTYFFDADMIFDIWYVNSAWY